MRTIVAALVVGAALASCAPAETPAVELRYRPAPGQERLYRAQLSALLDFALGRGTPVTGDMRFGLTASAASEADGDRAITVRIRDGQYQVQTQRWDFSEQAVSWTWLFSPLHRVRKPEAEPPQGLAAILQLALGFVFSTEFPTAAIRAGETWEVRPDASGSEGEASAWSARHTLTGLEDTPDLGPVAQVESVLVLPVEADFVGARWRGTFTGTSTARFALEGGEAVSAHVQGHAELTGGGARVALREVDLTLERADGATRRSSAAWIAGLERSPGLSGSYVTDAVLGANLVRYLRDNWVLATPRARYAVSDGYLLGAGVAARRSGRYLTEGSAYLGSDSLRGVYALSVTHGYPVRPTNQQSLSVTANSNARTASLGYTHFEGRRIGATGIPRMRYSASVSAGRLLANTDRFRSEGPAHYVTLGARRIRSGTSLVPRGKLDWEADATVTLATRALGGRYGFTLADATWIGTVRLSSREAVTARVRGVLGLGEVPDQFRTVLVDRTALRGHDLASAPLVTRALTASLEYRAHIGKADLFGPIGETDWWGALFLDAGVGGDSRGQLLGSPVYADVGLTLRVGAQYRSVPLYGYVSLAWPLVEGRSDPRVTLGVDWAF